MRMRPWSLAALLLAFTASSAPWARGEDEEPAPDPMPEEGADEGGQPEGGEAPGGDGAEPAADRTKTFPNINLSWTLPPPSKPAPPKEGEEATEPAVWVWGSAGNAAIQKQENGLVATAGLVRSGETLIEAELFIQPAKPGSGLEGFVDNQDNVDNLGRNFETTPTPAVERNVPIGNWHGGAIVATGKGKSGRPLQIRIYLLILKGIVYQVTVSAHDHAQRDHNKDLLAAIAGLKFKDTDEGVRGPIAAPFPSHTEPRGKAGTEEKLDKGVLKLKKPALFASLDTANRGGNALESWPFAAEARKPGAYAFVAVKRIRLPKSQVEGEAPELEAIVDELESKWINDTSEPVTRPKSDKTNRTASAFKGGKGYAYVFRGNAHGVPWVEKGWVVKDAGAIWVIRTQFGGKDAETALGGEVNTLVKSLAMAK